ncbi:MAG: monofunctional biosynthetic peptidoglycan transglycosylase [Chlorobiaceae bacterium]|jgi:monofunctional biosynthetic peptidoglycan transglycosylase|nr:monofunctional biosynthetic peptidoglycan transglycosylase [Chlorobiaceae bacterium]
MRLLRNTIAIVLLLFVFDIGRYLVYPDVGRLARENPSVSAFMEYREAQWKQEGLDDKRVRQRWVSLDRVSPNLVKAVLIAEDNKFWQHGGFDYEAIEKAIEKNIEAREFRSGASTISQQLAKNLYLSPSKNPVRKIKEAILTWRIEHTLSKRRILELYVNVAEWGDGIFGIEQAARTYYGVSAAGLSAQQAAQLAAVLPNPLKYSPVNPSGYVRNRARRIYAIMRQRGIVLPDYQEVMAPPPDTTTVDSVVIGVPDYLIEQAVSADSTASGLPEQTASDNENNHSVADPQGEGDDTGAGTTNP